MHRPVGLDDLEPGLSPQVLRRDRKGWGWVRVTCLTVQPFPEGPREEPIAAHVHADRQTYRLTVSVCHTHTQTFRLGGLGSTVSLRKTLWLDGGEETGLTFS